MANRNDKDWGLFATIFTAVFGLTYAFLNRNKQKQESQNSGSKNMKSIASVLTEFAKYFSDLQTFLNFEDVFRHVKAFDESKDAVRAKSYLDDQIAETEMMWKKIHDLDVAYSSLVTNINTSEPLDLQKTKNQLSKFWQLPGMLKNILVIRGRILRFIKKLAIAGDKSAIKEAKDKEVLTRLMHEFTNAKNLASQELEKFNKAMESLNI